MRRKKKKIKHKKPKKKKIKREKEKKPFDFSLSQRWEKDIRRYERDTRYRSRRLVVYYNGIVAAVGPCPHPSHIRRQAIYEIKNEAETAQIPKRYAATKQAKWKRGQVVGALRALTQNPLAFRQFVTRIRFFRMGLVGNSRNVRARML